MSCPGLRPILWCTRRRRLAYSAVLTARRSSMAALPAPPLSPDAVAVEIVARLPELREQLGSDDAEVQLRATHDIRRMMSAGTRVCWAVVCACEPVWALRLERAACAVACLVV